MARITAADEMRQLEQEAEEKAAKEKAEKEYKDRLRKSRAGNSGSTGSSNAVIPTMTKTISIPMTPTMKRETRSLTVLTI